MFTGLLVYSFTRLCIYSLTGLLISLSIAVPAYADITGSSVWYRLDETSGITATDSSGNGRTGDLDLTGDWRTGTTCKVAGCLAWSAAQGTQVVQTHATIATLGTASAMTIAAWFNATGTPRDAAEVYNLAPIVLDGGFYIGLFWGKISGGTESLYVYNWDGSEDRQGAAYTQGQWTHLGLVHGGGQLKLYINGVFISQTASGNTEVTSGTMQVGHAFLSGQCTLCLIDEVRIFPTAKADADMAELYSFGLASRRTLRLLLVE